MDEKLRIDLKNDSTTSSLLLNKDSIDAYTQIASNSINAFQNKKRQEWVRNELIDIMSQSNPSEIRSSSPSMDSLGFNDDLHHNQSKSNPNVSIYKANDCTSNKQFCNSYFGKTTPLTNNENFGLPSTTNSTKINSTSSNLKEINSLQYPDHKQRQVHRNNNYYELNERNNKNEIFFSNDISSKQHNSNFKKKKNVNTINHCDDIRSSPQFYMKHFHDFIVMQQKKFNKKFNDSSNDSIFSTQDHEYYDIEKYHNIVPSFKSQDNEFLQSVQWSNIYPFLNPRPRYICRDDVHTIENLPQTKPRTWSKMISNFPLDQSSKVKNPFHNLPNKNPTKNPKFVNKVHHPLANNERKVTFSMQNVRYVRTSIQHNQSDLDGRQNFGEHSNQIEGSHYSNANDQSKIYNPSNLEIDNISKNNYIQENNRTQENNYTPENNNILENNYTFDKNYTLQTNSFTPENNYTPENNNTLENNYTLDNNYPLENSYTPEIIDDFESIRTESEPFCELETIQPYSKQFSTQITVPSNYYVPPLQDEGNLESFDTTSLENNKHDVPVCTEFQYNSSNPSISNDNFLDPLNETVNCNRNEFYDATRTSRNDPCAYNETMDYYNGRNYDHSEVNKYNNLSLYNESGGYNSRDSDQFDDKQTYNESPNFGDRNFDKYEVDENNHQYYNESASCSGSDQSFDRFETDQIDNNLENNKRSFASFNDNSPKSFSSTPSQRSVVGTIDLPEELDLQEDPQIELVRSIDCTQELEKMKIGRRESIDCVGGSIHEFQGEVEEMVPDGECQESLTALQNEMKLRSQNEIKESLRDELEEGLEEVLNPDIQGMEDSILQLLAKLEAEMESLERRVKAERNRGEISSKSPVEMEGYKKRREEHERIREEKRQKLLGSLSAIVNGNPRQPTTYSTCNFCNLEYSEGIEIESGDFKSTIVTNKEILELIQRNELESKNLSERIQNTLNASANPIVYNDQTLDPSITSLL